MQIRISEELYTILRYARDEAMRTGCYAISADHLILGLLRHGENTACLLLKELGVSLPELKRYVDSRLFADSSVPWSAGDQICVGRSAQNVINLSAFEALKAGSGEVQSLHLLLALSRSAGTASAGFLEEKGAGTKEMIAKLESHGWRRSDAVQTPAPEEVEKSIESQIRSLVLITPSTSGGRIPS